MVDSVKLVDEQYANRIHGNRPSGRLHKGHNVTAATASIPSRYQTVVISNADKKGFLARSSRFQYDSSANDHPGPGAYVSHGSTEKYSTSFSKKGTGGFASKDRRILKHKAGFSPGPNIYCLPSFVDNTRKDFNKAQATSAFHKPIAQKREKIINGPAPNSYNILQKKIGKSNNVSADAAFKSQSKREMLNVADAATKPAPWQYNVSDEMLRPEPKVPMSSFKSKTVRKMQVDQYPVPGPGTYHPGEEIDPVVKTIFPRKHYLCISAPAMPLPSTPPSPGPGSYELISYDGVPKHYMSGSNFVSTTSRWSGDIKHSDLPGPAHYRPSEAGKQSFIYNAQSRWI